MPITTRPATVADVPEMVEVYMSAFAANPIGQRFFPASSPQTRPFLACSFAAEIAAEPLARWRVALDEDLLPGGGVVALCKWIAPEPEPAGGGEAGEEGPKQVVFPSPDTPEFPADGDPVLAKAFFDTLAAQHAKIMAAAPPALDDGAAAAGATGSSSDHAATAQDAQHHAAQPHHQHPAMRRHWYLELIATRSEFFGRGAGSQLMRWGVGEADAGGLECYLDATPDGRPVYERFGFETVETMSFLDGAIEQAFMVRKPGAWGRRKGE